LIKLDLPHTNIPPEKTQVRKKFTSFLVVLKIQSYKITHLR
jgi:hypothetical protein